MKTKSSPGGPDRYADILLDDWFKRSFKEYRDAKSLMLLFLQTLIPERKVASITYVSEESTNQNPGNKGVRVDVECTDENGKRFLVEVQEQSKPTSTTELSSIPHSLYRGNLKKAQAKQVNMALLLFSS